MSILAVLGTAVAAIDWLWNLARSAGDLIGEVARALWDNYYEELRYVAIFTAFALVRAAGKTVQTGQTGLKFSFGRATKLCEPGFYPLVPFLQVVRVVATRDRTLDLPQQRVTTFDGLVYDVDANLVFRVVEVRKALIEIDDLDRGMYQVLGLGVQAVLRGRERASMHVSDELDRELAARLTERLAAWGVEVQRAGFTSIRPTERTLRVTQLASVTGERGRMLAALESQGLARRAALGLLGPHQGVPARRTKRLQRLARARRRVRAAQKLLDRAEADGLLDPARLPRGWRATYEERALLGELTARGGFGGKGSNRLFQLGPERPKDPKPEDPTEPTPQNARRPARS